MKRLTIFVIMVLALLPFAFAGSIENDCVDSERYCAQYGERVCTHWHGSYCQSWNTPCIEYADRCTDSVDTETTIDADTVQGIDVVSEIDETNAYIEANNEAWLVDNVGGGGVSSRYVEEAITNLKTEISSQYCTVKQYTDLEIRVTMIEQFLSQFGYTVSPTTCYNQDGIRICLSEI